MRSGYAARPTAARGVRRCTAHQFDSATGAPASAARLDLAGPHQALGAGLGCRGVPSESQRRRPHHLVSHEVGVWRQRLERDSATALGLHRRARASRRQAAGLPQRSLRTYERRDFRLRDVTSGEVSRPSPGSGLSSCAAVEVEVLDIR